MIKVKSIYLCPHFTTRIIDIRKEILLRLKVHDKSNSTIGL